MAAIYKSKASMQAYNIEIQEGKTEKPKEKKSGSLEGSRKINTFTYKYLIILSIIPQQS